MGGRVESKKPMVERNTQPGLTGEKKETNHGQTVAFQVANMDPPDVKPRTNPGRFLLLNHPSVFAHHPNTSSAMDPSV